MPSLLIAALSTTAAAQDARVSAETPSRDSAVLLLDAVWSALPDVGVVVYLDCGWPDCRGQVPDWFESEGWVEGLIAGGLELSGEDVGISPERLEQLWLANRDHPPILALSLAHQLDSSEAAKHQRQPSFKCGCSAAAGGGYDASLEGIACRRRRCGQGGF